MKRREARQKALQALFEMDLGKVETYSAIAHVMEDVLEAAAADTHYIRWLVLGTGEHLHEIDEMLTEYLQGWKLERLGRVDLNVLRLASFELLNEYDVDVATICDEAVELAKHFSTEESGKFVNGVLARLLPTVQLKRSAAVSAKSEKTGDAE